MQKVALGHDPDDAECFMVRLTTCTCAREPGDLVHYSPTREFKSCTLFGPLVGTERKLLPLTTKAHFKAGSTTLASCLAWSGPSDFECFEKWRVAPIRIHQAVTFPWRPLASNHDSSGILPLWLRRQLVSERRDSAGQREASGGIAPALPSVPPSSFSR